MSQLCEAHVIYNILFTIRPIIKFLFVSLCFVTRFTVICQLIEDKSKFLQIVSVLIHRTRISLQ